MPCKPQAAEHADRRCLQYSSGSTPVISLIPVQTQDAPAVVSRRRKTCDSVRCPAMSPRQTSNRSQNTDSRTLGRFRTLIGTPGSSPPPSGRCWRLQSAATGCSESGDDRTLEFWLPDARFDWSDTRKSGHFLPIRAARETTATRRKP